MKFKIIENEFFFSALFKTETRDFYMALLGKIMKLIKVSSSSVSIYTDTLSTSNDFIGSQAY